MASALLLSVVYFLCLAYSQSVLGVCPPLDYGTMDTVRRDCTKGHPSIANSVYTNGRTQVTGAELVTVFRDYCGDLDQIQTCVQSAFTSRGCSDSDLQTYTAKVDVSNYFCDDGDVKPFIEDIFQNISAVGLSGSDDPCMRAAEIHSNTCRNQALTELTNAGIFVGIEGLVTAIVETMPCTLNGVIAENCLGAILTTSLHYGSTVIPPQLGVNVSRILLTMADMD